jgi:ankyrin repeat protein
MGLDPNARTAKGATPLSLVYEPFMIKDLVIKGARIEDGEAWSPERQECARAIMRECKLEGDMEWWRNSGSADSVHVKLLLLQLSIFCGREDLLYGIIGPGLSPGYKDRHSGWHIIHFAVVFPRSRGCLRNLLQLGVDPICRNDRQATPMVLAIKNRNSEAVAEILESETWRSTHKTIPPSIHPDRNVLFDAISADHVETIKVLLENGYDPNYIRDGYGTPLYYALELNSPNLRRAVETLLYFGARAEHLNLVDLLSMMGKWRTITVVVELLLSNGADPNSKMDGYETPLHRISRASEHAEAHQVVKILLKHGADPTILDEHGLTPLEHAIQRSREQHPFNDILNSIVDSLQQAMDSRRS